MSAKEPGIPATALELSIRPTNCSTKSPVRPRQRKQMCVRTHETVGGFPSIGLDVRKRASIFCNSPRNSTRPKHHSTFLPKSLRKSLMCPKQSTHTDTSLPDTDTALPNFCKRVCQGVSCAKHETRAPLCQT